MAAATNGLTLQLAGLVDAAIAASNGAVSSAAFAAGAGYSAGGIFAPFANAPGLTTGIPLDHFTSEQNPGAAFAAAMSPRTAIVRAPDINALPNVTIFEAPDAAFLVVDARKNPLPAIPALLPGFMGTQTPVNSSFAFLGGGFDRLRIPARPRAVQARPHVSTDATAPAADAASPAAAALETALPEMELLSPRVQEDLNAALRRAYHKQTGQIPREAGAFRKAIKVIAGSGIKNAAPMLYATLAQITDRNKPGSKIRGTVIELIGLARLAREGRVERFLPAFRAVRAETWRMEGDKNLIVRGIGGMFRPSPNALLYGRDIAEIKVWSVASPASALLVELLGGGHADVAVEPGALHQNGRHSDAAVAVSAANQFLKYKQLIASGGVRMLELHLTSSERPPPELLYAIYNFFGPGKVRVIWYGHNIDTAGLDLTPGANGAAPPTAHPAAAPAQPLPSAQVLSALMSAFPPAAGRGSPEALAFLSATGALMNSRIPNAASAAYSALARMTTRNIETDQVRATANRIVTLARLAARQIVSEFAPACDQVPARLWTSATADGTIRRLRKKMAAPDPDALLSRESLAVVWSESLDDEGNGYLVRMLAGDVDTITKRTNAWMRNIGISGPDTIAADFFNRLEKARGMIASGRARGVELHIASAEPPAQRLVDAIHHFFRAIPPDAIAIVWYKDMLTAAGERLFPSPAPAISVDAAPVADPAEPMCIAAGGEAAPASEPAAEALIALDQLEELIGGEGGIAGTCGDMGQVERFLDDLALRETPLAEGLLSSDDPAALLRRLFDVWRGRDAQPTQADRPWRAAIGDAAAGRKIDSLLKKTGTAGKRVGDRNSDITCGEIRKVLAAMRRDTTDDALLDEISALDADMIGHHAQDTFAQIQLLIVITKHFVWLGRN